MSRKANPAMIGGFVLGAIALLVVALAAFGSARFFTHRPRAVAFFQGSIQGLTEGSAVNLRGVPIGTVTGIELRLDVKDMQPVIPVYMEFDPRHLKLDNAALGADVSNQKLLRDAIAKGLHAKLATQSLVTGQLVIELDLDPDEPRRMVGADPATVEIPTAPSDIDKLKRALSQLPLDKLAGSALQLLQNTDRLVTSEDLHNLLRSLAAAGDNLNGLLGDARRDLPGVVADVHGTAGSASKAFAAAEKAVGDLQTTLKTADRMLNSDVRDALRVAASALLNAQKALANADTLIAPNSPQRYDIDQALQNLAATTKSLRIFAEDLERRPNSLVVGK